MVREVDPCSTDEERRPHRSKNYTKTGRKHAPAAPVNQERMNNRNKYLSILA